jgi:Flp pilus assembly protein TadG
MTWRLRLQSLARDTRGAVLVEFAIIGPAFIVMLIGVLQVASWMQNYNAVRSVASDAARKVLVQYQRDNELNQGQIESLVVSTAVGAPYYLDSEDLTVVAGNATTQRVTGAREINLQITYAPANFLPLVHLSAFNVQYSRPIFVVDPT